jgi:hypothetical protein
MYDSGYPQLPSDMLPGVEASTVLVFDAVDSAQAVRFVWDGPHTSDYSTKFLPYQWTATDTGLKSATQVAPSNSAVRQAAPTPTRKP